MIFEQGAMSRLQKNWPYFERCLYRNATKGPSSRRVTFVDEKSKDCVNLVEIQDEIKRSRLPILNNLYALRSIVMAAKRM